MLKQRHQLFVGLLRCSDAMCLAAACLTAWWLVTPQPGELITEPLTVLRESFAALVVPVMMVTMPMNGLYRPRRDRALFGEFVLIARATVMSMLIVIAISWLLSGTGIGHSLIGRNAWGAALLAEGAIKAQLGLIWILVPLMLGVERVTVRIGLRAMRRRGWNMRDVAIVGVGRLGQITARTLSRNAWTGLRVGYFVSHHPSTARTECLGRPIHGGIDRLESVLEERPVDAVYIAVPNLLASQVPEILARLDRFAVDVRLVPDVRPKHLPQSMSVSELEGMPILSYRENPMAGLNGMVKRGMDVVGAGIGIVLFSPLLLVIAAVLFVTSKDPVVFTQRRVSLGGEIFKIYKFRTMASENANTSGGWTRPDDPRITRFGALLRRTSLDELPQLFNVLLGDMSLVGPRPEREDLIDKFRDDWRGYMLRQHVKAGMTGWAQINGHRGNTSLRKRLQYDLFYIRNWSIWFDLWILLLTPFRGFVHRNAY